MRNPKAACPAGGRSCWARGLPPPWHSRSRDGAQPPAAPCLHTHSGDAASAVDAPGCVAGCTQMQAHLATHAFARTRASPACPCTHMPCTPPPTHPHVHLLALRGMHPAHRCMPCMHACTHASCTRTHASWTHMHAHTCTCACTPYKHAPPACTPMHPARALQSPPHVSLTHS